VLVVLELPAELTADLDSEVDFRGLRDAGLLG